MYVQHKMQCTGTALENISILFRITKDKYRDHV